MKLGHDSVIIHLIVPTSNYSRRMAQKWLMESKKHTQIPTSLLLLVAASNYGVSNLYMYKHSHDIDSILYSTAAILSWKYTNVLEFVTI